MGKREEEIARNEGLFRDVNERVKGVLAEIGVSDQLEVFCECGRGDCVAKIELSLPDYEAVRAYPARFLVLQGHEFPEVEDVLVSPDGYLIVEKREPFAEIARESNA